MRTKRQIGLSAAIFLAWSFTAIAAVQAQQVGSGLGDATTRSSAAVDISSDTMELMEKQRQAIFTGNVDAVRGKVKLRSDRLVVDYVEVKRRNGTKKTEVRFLNASGNVVIISGGQTITSQRARMDVKANKALITGNVRVLQGKTKLNGERLHLNLTTGESHMEGTRVRMQWKPQE